MRSENQPLLGARRSSHSGTSSTVSPPLAVPGAEGLPDEDSGFESAGPDTTLVQHSQPFPRPERRGSTGNVYDFTHAVLPSSASHKQRASTGGGLHAGFLGPTSLPVSPPFESGPVRRFLDDLEIDKDGRVSAEEADRAWDHPNGAGARRRPLDALGGTGSPERGGRALTGSLRRSQTAGPGTFHAVEVGTPGRHSNCGEAGEHCAAEGLAGSGPGPRRGRPEPHILEEALYELDPDFDLSAPHLMKLFNTLDRDQNGRLTYEELREGLLSMRGMHTIPAAKVDGIIRKLDKDESLDISQARMQAS
ncbi:hypothetical protein NSK_005167 [Nannochloropsis salina CCMP1776]|uniref:EF-hand domain-containing protein n=1 Tax=Nannochloropsis salina CCMP1776 TaxID=1027361 RepID=A0A4D9CWE9_9STRA|nr:hypothetical protein NSK_005167 [Nannochloropsis salina CCMP1776]|eukprot:TFJ83520.1 hypothetical protein NSK_005167 [Nannochloropsis salina CCMP1776]